MNEQIERLKNNEKPFGLLSKEDQELLCEINNKYGLEWFDGSRWSTLSFRPWEIATCSSFRIHKDYHPEPKVIRCEVYEESGWLWFGLPSGSDYTIDEAVAIPNFIAYDYGYGHTAIHPRLMCNELDKKDITAQTPKYVLFAEE